MNKRLRIYAELAARYPVDLPGKISEHFSPEEFQCGMDEGCPHCHGKVFLSPNLILLLEAIREAAGSPVSICSGYRCEGHNSDLKKASKNSAHMVGMAADLLIPKNLIFSEFLEICKEQTSFFHGGCGGYKKSGFVHVDVRCTPPDRRWGE